MVRARPTRISVVMPVRNEERHVGAQLGALAGQDYRGAWELVVADNRSTDRTISIVESFRRELPSLTIVDASRRVGINHARNMGAAAARGELLVFCDGDDRAASGWLDALARAAPEADVLAGSLDLDALNADTRAREMCPWEAPGELEAKHGLMPYAPGGNCGVWADVAQAVKWDESFRFGNSDIEFSWRAQLAGWRLSFVPDAVMQVRLKGSLSDLARQYYGYGRSDPQLYRRFRRHGMDSPRRTQPTDSWRTLVSTARALRGTPAHQADWTRDAARKLGRVVGSLQHGVAL